MKKAMILMFLLLLMEVNAFAAGDLTVNGTVNTGSGGVKFLDGTTQTTAAFQVLSEGTAFPGTNAFTITIPPTTGKIKLSYQITPTADADAVMIGFNDNLTATGTYTLYSVGVYPAIAGKVHAGYARTSAGSAGQYNNFDIIPTDKLIMVAGDHLSESNLGNWAAIFKGYLKYGSEQTITKINLKCYNAGTTISRIDWKVVALQ